jgi:hypothetical protein
MCLNFLLLSNTLQHCKFYDKLPYQELIIFDSLTLETFVLTPLSNGLSDHEAQFLEILYTNLEPQNQTAAIDKENRQPFTGLICLKLSYETCDTIFSTTPPPPPMNNNNNDNSSSSSSHIKDKHSSTFKSDPSHYLVLAFNNFFPNIQLKFSTTKETESFIKSHKPKNKCGYEEIATKLLKNQLCLY